MNMNAQLTGLVLTDPAQVTLLPSDSSTALIHIDGVGDALAIVDTGLDFGVLDRTLTCPRTPRAKGLVRVWTISAGCTQLLQLVTDAAGAIVSTRALTAGATAHRFPDAPTAEAWLAERIHTIWAAQAA